MGIRVLEPMVANASIPLRVVLDDTCVREVVAHVLDPSAAPPGSARELLGQTHLTCQKGGRWKSALSCLRCPRFVNFVPHRDWRSLRVRCAWSRQDKVSCLMTRASQCVTVHAQTGILSADELARARRVNHLLVVDDEMLVGIACRCDLALADAAALVADCMTRTVWVIEPETTVGEAVDILAREQVGCLPVVKYGILCGMVTRGDLCRIGVEPEDVGMSECAACGRTAEVHHHPRSMTTSLCLECLEATTLALPLTVVQFDDT